MIKNPIPVNMGGSASAIIPKTIIAMATKARKINRKFFIGIVLLIKAIPSKIVP